MRKFKEGDVIEPIEKGRGFEQARVVCTFVETKRGKYKGREMYLLRIFCGTATIPVETESCYKLINKSTKIRI